MTDDLFASGDQTSKQNEDLLAELVGENKKFKDVQALAKGKLEADQTIEQMKTRLDELREDNKRLFEQRKTETTLQELVDKLKTQQPSSGTNTPVAENVNASLKPEDYRDMARKEFQQLKAEEQSQANLNVVQQRLKDQYGDKYQTILSEQRDNLKLTAAQVNELARTSPEAFFRIMGMDAPSQNNQFQSPPRSVQRSDSFAPSTNKRTWSYYQDLKKKDRALYYSPKIYNQMLKDAEDLGDAFKDGDFKAFGD